ncbi:MAG: hypothetical protein WCK59_04620 [Candidatus Falkowbacteria bacterium]
MKNNKIFKSLWFRTVLIMAIFIGVVLGASRLIIFSYPGPLHLYLEFLDRNSHREQGISVYSREEFAKIYFAVDAPKAYKISDFLNLFHERFNSSVVKENNLFKVYRVVSPDNPCFINIFGISKKKNLVYVSSSNICSKNAYQNK